VVAVAVAVAANMINRDWDAISNLGDLHSAIQG